MSTVKFLIAALIVAVAGDIVAYFGYHIVGLVCAAVALALAVAAYIFAKKKG